MFWKPIKHSAEVVNPPPAIKSLANSLFDRVNLAYRANYAKFRAEPHPHLNNVLQDPWFRREAWRWDPYFSPRNVLKKAFPGLGIAAGAFVLYSAYDTVVSSMSQGKTDVHTNGHN